MSREGLDPRKYTGTSIFQRGVELYEGQLVIPESMSPQELEWEFWVSKLHFGYPRATAEDLETIKEIANRL